MYFQTSKQKSWLILVLLLAWGNSNLVARAIAHPDLERLAVLPVAFLVAGLIVAIKPE